MEVFAFIISLCAISLSEESELAPRLNHRTNRNTHTLYIEMSIYHRDILVFYVTLLYHHSTVSSCPLFQENRSSTYGSYRHIRILLERKSLEINPRVVSAESLW